MSEYFHRAGLVSLRRRFDGFVRQSANALSRPRRVSRWLLLVFALRFGSLFPDALAGEDAPVPSTPLDDYGSIVKMSPFEIVANSLDFRNWVKLSSPHFVVYTDTDSKTATTLVKQMEMVHEAAQFFLHRRGINLASMIVVLPTTMSDWNKLASKGLVEWTPGESEVGSSRKLRLVLHDW
jgi:hypothetical protein